jgi:hypothetical protein
VEHSSWAVVAGAVVAAAAEKVVAVAAEDFAAEIVVAWKVAEPPKFEQWSDQVLTKRPSVASIAAVAEQVVVVVAVSEQGAWKKR